MPSPEFLLQDNFCVLPWQHLNLLQDGRVQLCCQSKTVDDASGVPLSLYERSLPEIWNSDYMRAIRSAMIQGIRVRSCRKCWDVEDRGGISRRLELNAAFQRTGGSIVTLKHEALANDLRVEMPGNFQLNMGNACNLKCLTCSSGSSSKIASDPVYLAWEKSYPRRDDEGGETSVTAQRQDGLPWYRDERFVLENLLGAPERITELQIIGGEPLAIRLFKPIVDHLFERDAAQHVVMGFTTNGSLYDEALMERLARFKMVSVSVSIDAIGLLFDYIRYPARWPEVLNNLERYAALPNVLLSVVPTFHVYNALHFAEILRFCETRNIRPISNPLWKPEYLRAEVLPPNMRTLVSKRLREFAAESTQTANSLLAEGLARQMDAAGTGFNAKALEEFMIFTNDLEQGRALRFADVAAETVSLLAEEGFPWDERTRHAGTCGTQRMKQIEQTGL